jgi:polysaccharide deacetylase family protein (PEP-CTERM system associated)
LSISNILSFDIEDWFHPEIFGDRFPQNKWKQLESRVQQSTEIILNFLSKKNLKATFFFLGWIAENYPAIVKSAAEEGHEIGIHGYTHTRIDALTPDEFRDELRLSISILESVTAKKILGFRAPTFSITKKTLWALPILLDEGLSYDSSIFPIFHDRYGIPDAPLNPYEIYKTDEKTLIEFPMSTVQICQYRFPVGGGGYFRLYPFWLTKKFMKKCQRENRSIIFYAHPWEFDLNLPKVDLSTFGRIRHYYAINKFLERLSIITDLFEFTSFEKSRLWESVSSSKINSIRYSKELLSHKVETRNKN